VPFLLRRFNLDETWGTFFDKETHRQDQSLGKVLFPLRIQGRKKKLDLEKPESSTKAVDQKYPDKNPGP